MTTSISISSCFENPQSVLRSAFIRNDLDAFRNALENLKADPNDVVELNSFKLPLFHHILMRKNSGAFIELCVKYDADMYTKDDQNRYPLHYVVDSLSPDNLRAFLKSYDASKINVKMDHRNSLHLLIESVMNNPENDNEDTAKCVKMLIEKGCDVNMPNEKSQTPFYMLLSIQKSLKNKNELIDFIVHNTEPDIFTYRSKQMKKMFTENNPHLQIPDHIETVINYDYLTSLLGRGDQNKFCSDFRAFKDSKQAKLDESEENKSNDLSECCSKLLYTAVDSNLEDVVDFLIATEKFDVNKKPDTKVHSPVHLACSRGNHRILQSLLKSQPPPMTINIEQQQNLLHVTAKNFGLDPNKSLSINYEKCFEIALEYYGKSADELKREVNRQDKIGFTPLHYAARYRKDKAVVDLLKNGGYIGTIGFNDETPIESMSKESLEEFLDDCITTNEKRYGDEEQEIDIDFNFLRAPKKNGEEFGPEIAPLQNIAQHPELRPLIRHPVLSSFLYLKWSQLFWLFLGNLVAFSIFMVSLIWYIVLSQSMTADKQANSSLFSLVRAFAVISVFFLIIREALQLTLSVKNYFKSAINYFEIALIAVAITLLYMNHNEDNTNHTYLRALRAITILLSAYEFLILFGKLPYLSISTHMVILRKVAQTFFKSLMLFSVPLLAFALSFYCLFGGHKDDMPKNGTAVEKHGEKEEEKEENDDFNSFGYPGIAIIKTFVMLTGEFDASELQLGKSASYGIIFLLFVFLITIVLFNLMNALAIDDTQEIKKEGELVDLCEKISELSKSERVILPGPIRFLKQYISVFPNLPFGKIVVLPNKNNEISTRIATGKSSKNNGDVKIAINSNQQEQLQPLNKSTPALLRKESLSLTLDNKIMKNIRNVLEEKRSKGKECQAGLKNRISSMESELTMLRSSINHLVNLIERNN